MLRLSKFRDVPKNKILCLALVLIGIIIILHTVSEVSSINSPKFYKRKSEILMWTPRGLRNDALQYLKKVNSVCGNKCHLTLDRKAIETADAVVFFPLFMRNFSASYPIRDNPNQYFVFWEHETPFQYPMRNISLPTNFFNATATYMRSSDIPIPYGTYEPIQRDVCEVEFYNDLMENITRKTNGVYAVYSHCDTPSGRELLIEDLQKYIKVDVFGRCPGGQPCDKSCYQTNMQNYRFYLSFENTACDDYISEKFYNFNSLVPIVLKREYYSNSPPKSFIAVDDFKNLEDLAEYLNLLMVDNAKYAEHLMWTYNLQRTTRSRHMMMCNVCDYIVRRPERKSYERIEEYVDPSRVCDLEFKNKLLANRI